MYLTRNFEVLEFVEIFYEQGDECFVRSQAVFICRSNQFPELAKSETLSILFLLKNNWYFAHSSCAFALTICSLSLFCALSINRSVERIVSFDVWNELIRMMFVVENRCFHRKLLWNTKIIIRWTKEKCKQKFEKKNFC